MGESIRKRAALLAAVMMMGLLLLAGCKKSGGDPKDVAESEQTLQPLPAQPTGSAVPMPGGGSSGPGAPADAPTGPPGG